MKQIILNSFLFKGVASEEEVNIRYLEEVAVKIANDIAVGNLKVDRSKKGLIDKLTATIMDIEFVRNKIFEKAREQVMKMSGGLYPAPLKVIYFIIYHILFNELITYYLMIQFFL